MNKTAKWVMLGTAALLLWPMNIESHRSAEDGGKITEQTSVGGLLYRLNVRRSGEKKEVTLDLLSGDTIRAASGKIRESAAAHAAARKEKKLTRQHQPLFRSALDFVSKRTVTDAGALAKKLKVGIGCGEAFLEMMEEMGIVRQQENGKYRVMLPKKHISTMI